MAGVKIRYFLGAIGLLAVAAVPIWFFVLDDFPEGQNHDLSEPRAFAA